MLRDVVMSDLETFFRHQRDASAAAMAVFAPRDWDTFISHWQNSVLGNPDGEVRTILVEQMVAGYVASWEQDGRRLVAYWIGQEYWGRGIAASALVAFLRDHEQRRPIHAWVAKTNARSIRVLEKSGFQRVGETASGPNGVVEELFRLAGAA
ncbi:MAG: GNAT family N-acetyltransferase [Gemmatimonadaceae bacterium]|nr:GNAT family N-acetyltransferase [Gemmatimonadaceae bacterium]